MKKPVQLFALLAAAVIAISLIYRRKSAGGPLNIRDINNNPNLSKTGLGPEEIFGLAEIFAPKSQTPTGQISVFTPAYGSTSTVDLESLIAGNEGYLGLPNGFGSIISFKPTPPK